MNLKRFLHKLNKGLDVVNLNAKISYSQIGEDLIVDYLFNSLNINNPTYLDIGTNQPISNNNTYLFYTKNCKGVCIEPNIDMCKLIRKKRPNDTLLNIGIGLSDTQAADFYLFPGLLNGWSTFSQEEALKRQNESGITPQKISIALKPINEIIEKYFDPYPNFISIDVEGLDMDILKSIDFQQYQPEVICVETIIFSTTNSETKLLSIIEFLDSKGYLAYADTHVNTIFCRKNLFNIEK